MAGMAKRRSTEPRNTVTIGVTATVDSTSDWREEGAQVTRLDRLARSTRDLLNTLATITDRKAGFRSLGDAWADPTTPHGRLMLTVLGGLAEFERELIRARTSEGRTREGAWPEPWPTTQADPASTARCAGAQGRRRVGPRDRPQLCRQRQHISRLRDMAV